MPRTTARTVSDRLSIRLRERMSNPKDVWGIPWGFPKLDHITHGIQQEEMTVLAARPGVGKSSFAGQVALNVARHFKSTGSNKVVRIISLEMSAESYQARIASYLSEIPVYRAESGFINREQANLWNEKLIELAELPIEYEDTGLTLDRISEFVHRDGSCGFWIVDHIGIVPTEMNSTVAAMAVASSRFRDLSVHVAPSLILCQLNRQSIQGEDKRPQLEGLYGGDRLAQDARKVFGLHRDDIYMRLSPEDRQDPLPAELIILKSNNGQLATVGMTFLPTAMRWLEDE